MDSSPTPNHDQPANNPALTPNGERPEDRRDQPGGSPTSERRGLPPPSEDHRDKPGGSPVADDAPTEVPLTPMGWLAQNAIYLTLIAAGIAWLYWKFGWEGLPSAALTILGVGFIIFIHELGHFLVAKWCDVHVLTFSIGFGPALPGCSFKRGETTYKLSLLPLGGYVNMVGEGADADENEDYPRSFKNKSVGQRMAIISAGVIMNVLLGFLCFIFVFRLHGENRTAATVWKLDPGSPAWKAGVQPGWQIERLGNKKHPDFENLKETVMLVARDAKIPFYFLDPNHPDRGEIQIDLTPRREEGSLYPSVGIGSPIKLKLGVPVPLRREYPHPVINNSAAAAARVLNLKPGGLVLEATDPDNPDKLKVLQRGTGGGAWNDLARRLRQLSGKPVTLVVVRGGKKSRETIDLSADGFHHGDTIIGTTDPDKAQSGPGGYDPFVVSELRIDPRDPEKKNRDPFEFRQRMRQLADKPVVIQVHRQGAAAGEPPVDLFVPPAYYKSFGARMEMGDVAAVRVDSSAAQSGVHPRDSSGSQAGDKLVAVLMTDEGGRLLFLADAPGEVLRAVPFLHLLNRPLDPVRLPSQLTAAAAASPGNKRVILSVLRSDPVNHINKRLTVLPPTAWDDTWKYSAEEPLTLASPLSVPQLGLAYWVTSKVVEVEKNSPAAAAGLQPDDLITEVRLKVSSKKPGEYEWGPPANLQRGKEELYDEWAYVFSAMQGADIPEIQLKVRRGDEKLTVKLNEEDRDWPRASRGLLLMADQHLVKAGNMLEALEFGYNKTVRFITGIYLGLSRMFSGQVSVKTLGGPIEIVSATFTMARYDIWELISFLGVLSINLAVVNFLPIPLLDGGHMVFLIYEKIRGKPASEGVRATATYIGLALLLSLMVFVVYLDGHRKGWW